MGCSIMKAMAEEERQLRRTADAFRSRVVREVVQNREKFTENSRASQEYSVASISEFHRSNSVEAEIMNLNRSASIGSHLSADTENRTSMQSRGSDALEPRKDSVGLKPLRSVSHIERHSTVVGDHPVDHKGDISVLVPGKVGCEDDKVVIKGDTNSLLRTRRVHKHKRGAKKVWASRHMSNLEAPVEPLLEDCEQTEQMLPEEEKRLVIKVLQRHFLSASLQQDEHEMLVQQVVRLEKTKGDVICQKGEKGDSCYIIISGVCAVQREKAEQVAQLSAGHTFGELAMLYDVPRTATVACVSPRVVVCQIRGCSFRRCLALLKERTLSETLGFLNNHEIFSKLALEEKRMFANALSPQVFERGALVIDEHISSTADWMFLIQEGTVEVTDQYKNRKVLEKNASFSGQRMPYGQKAVAAKTLSRLRVLAIGHAVMNRLFGNISEVLRRAAVRHLLADKTFFVGLTERQQIIVAASLEEHHFKKGETIVTAMANPQLVLVMEGEVLVVDEKVSAWDPGKGAKAVINVEQELFITEVMPVNGFTDSEGDHASIQRDHDNAPELELPHARSLQQKSGNLKDCPLEVPPKILLAGDVYGESTFKENCCMEHTLITRTDALVCRVGHDELCRALRGHSQKTPPLSWIIQRNKIKEHLREVFPFSALYEEMLDILVEAFETLEYQFDEAIVRAGDTTRCFCLVIEGEAVLRKGDSVEPLGRWSSFGVAQMLLDKPVKYTILAAATGCTVKKIDTGKFMVACGALFNELAVKMKYQDMQIQYSDIEFHGKLGEGQFGVVKRVGVSNCGDDFALKRMNKATILDLDQQGPVKLEREILQECCHPLIVRLVTTFQDERSVYILMENLHGGDLFTAIRDIGVLTEEHTLFYGASVVVGIEYLHSRGIIYRDLKPENVMLTNAGFVKLVDMGCCTRKVRSYTFVGTPEYLAPEVVLGKGYGQAVDWWSVGVIMYEMICGPLPFGEGCSDPLEVMREVLEKPLPIPTKVTPEASDLLTSLLERMPEQRLGSSTLKMSSEVREHAFFELLQWDAVLEHSTMPPYVPVPHGSSSMPLRGAASVGSISRISSQKGADLLSDDDGCPSQGDASDEEPLPPPEGADLSCFEGF